jgi:hypothetical protein
MVKMSDIREGMIKHIGKHVHLPDGEIIIKDVYTCYDGDFFKVSYLSGKKTGENEDINIWTEKGNE